jgi:hypothetical protein
MKHRLATEAGRKLYKLRKQTVKPVSGSIKEVIGFRRFSLGEAQSESGMGAGIRHLQREKTAPDGAEHPERPENDLSNGNKRR